VDADAARCGSRHRAVDNRVVPAVAADAKAWRVVSFHGHAGSHRLVHCHECVPSHTVLGYYGRCSPRFVVVSELV